MINQLMKTRDEAVTETQDWTRICSIQELPIDAGVAALLYVDTPEEIQIALFRIADDDTIYAVSNFDPFSEANVLARGIICSIGDEMTVASPVLKQHFNLVTGQCLEDENVSLATFPVKIVDCDVLVAS